MTSDRGCYVFVALPGTSEYVVAGRFRGSVTNGGDPLGEFVYGRSYLSRPDAVELDPVQLRLSEDVRRTSDSNGVFGVMRDAMPNVWGCLRIEDGAEGRTPQVLDQPVWGPTDAVGALLFAPGLEPPRSVRRFNSIDELPSIQVAGLASGARREAGTSRALVGERPKAIVEDNHVLWVAKLAQAHTVWNHARIRHATLQLARDCGLDTPPSRIERIRGQDVLLVLRCDRDWTGNGYASCRVVSGLTFLGTGDSLAERRRWSYLTLADEVRRTSSHPKEDLRELFRRVCFNAAISNRADPLCYPIMIAWGTGWRLAPDAGLAPTPVTDGADRDLAMICGPEGRTPSRENILGGAGRFLLDRSAAAGIFDGLRAAVRSSWYAVMRGNGVSARDCELVARSIGDGGGAGDRRRSSAS